MDAAQTYGQASISRGATTMGFKRAKQKGRSEGRHLGIGHHVVRSAEFGRLPPWSLKLLIELASGYNGYNNGNLSAAYTLLKERGWNSPGTLSAALQSLLETGWIIRTRLGHRNRCALYAVTWWPVDECPGKWLEVPPESVPRNTWKIKSVVGTCSSVVGTCIANGSEPPK